MNSPKKVNYLFGQEWDSDLYLAFDCALKDGLYFPKEVFTFLEMGGRIIRVHKKLNYQNKPLWVLNSKKTNIPHIMCWKIWQAEDSLVEKVVNKFYEPYI